MASHSFQFVLGFRLSHFLRGSCSGGLVRFGARGQAAWLWRIVLVAIGIALYRRSMILVASELHWIVPTSDNEWQFRARRLVFTSYLAGGLIACAGAVLDPRGAVEMLNSGAATSFLAALGLLRAPRLFRGQRDKHVVSDRVVDRNLGWMLAAAVVSLFYIAILGPGLKVTL